VARPRHTHHLIVAFDDHLMVEANNPERVRAV
jgi:hypothetical protein